MKETQLTEWAVNQGPVIAILIFAIIFGYKYFSKHAEKQATDLKSAWDAKEKESDKRFDDLKDRFNASDRRHDECEKQKRDLEMKLFHLACLTGNTDVLKTKPIKAPDETT